MAKVVPFLVVILFSILSVRALFHTGLPPTHDGEYHIVRFYEFDEALRDGEVYPRWARDLNFGYGVPLFNFVYPLPNYLASFLHLFGISFIDSFKIIMVFGSIVGAIFFYLWSKEYWGKFGGIISSILYIFSPYRFLDIFIRGSVGEVLALSIFPLCLWAIKKYSLNKNKYYFVLSTITLSLVIFSHNILGLMFYGVAVVYWFIISVYKKDKKILRDFFSIALLSVGLTAIFWLPALIEKSFTVGLEVFDFRNHFPEISQLVFPSWGSGFSGVKAKEQMSFQIGIVNLLYFIVGTGVLGVFIKMKKIKESVVLGSFIVVSLITVVLMLKVSLPIWENVPLLNYFQFPWRLLSVEIILIPFIGGSIAFLLRKHKSIVILGLLFTIILCIYASRNYNKVPYFLERPDSYYTSRSNFIDGTNSPGDAFNTIWFQPVKKRASSKLTISNGEGLLSDISLYNSRYQVTADIKSSNALLEVNSAYFPGWQATINGNTLEPKVSSRGTMFINLNSGKQVVEIKFNNTLIRHIGIIVTLVSLIAIFLYFFRDTIKNNLYEGSH